MRFADAINAISISERTKPGVLLSVIPNRDGWENFVADVRVEWRHWEWAFTLNPASLIVLYDGAAFYNYRSGAFWKDFAGVVGSAPMAPNIQTAVNKAYTKAAKRFGLRITEGSFVASAVSHIGIPISMWDGFLDVCEWALWANDWDAIEELAWREAMTRRLGGRILLIKFLVENRVTATQFVHEMLDARRVLSADLTLTVSEIAQALILRVEYFEEVPETADFLRPNDPESLFSDRGRLDWNEERHAISLHLPPVRHELLPAVWQLGDRQRAAADTALDLQLGGSAFAKKLRLQLVGDNVDTQQRINGIDGWSLYDEARSRFVNHNRELLPVSQYTLISRHRLAPQLDGWQNDPDDPRIDLESELEDGTRIFLTQLCAQSRRPRLKIGEGSWIEFAQRRGVTLRVFCGNTRKNAARFSVTHDGTVRSELWPRPFLDVPLSLVRDDGISSEFSVVLDGKPARGKWVTFQYDPPHAEAESAERAFCFWRWSEEMPPPLSSKSIVTRDLSVLDVQAISPTQATWCGLHTLHVESRRLGRLMFGSRLECHFELLTPTAENLWPTAWDDYTAWVLLSQVQDDATWEEVRIARDAVTMFADINLSVVYYQIRKLEKYGYLVVRGHRYRDFRSRITLLNSPSAGFRAEYCGLTSLLYELVRKVAPLSLAVAPSEPGYPAKLRIGWPQRERHDVRDACQKLGIEVVARLW